MKWEYKKVNWEELKSTHWYVENALDELGKEGWELCAINNGCYYFKRQIN